jgi:mono/diheme cytochrome c family protein
MRRTICIAIVLVAATAATLGQGRASSEAGDSGQAQRLLDTYCAGCHNSKARAGGVAFDGLALGAVDEHADVWEAAVRKLRGRLMPPPGSRQPDQQEIEAFVLWMEAALDRAAAGGPRAGHVPIQRLTRTEFATAVNDLLGLELDAADILPAEIEVDGFDNIAEALSVSPAFLDQYVAAARSAARMAIGESAPRRASVRYAVPEGDQSAHVDGLPLGTRGGMTFRHTFPADGEYRLTIPDLGIDLYTFVLETRHTLIVSVDGRELFRESLGGPDDLRLVDRGGAPARAEIMKRFENIPVQVTAGTRDLVITFIERARVESDEFVAVLPGEDFSRGHRAPRLVGGVRIVGPFGATGVSRTASRERIFVCEPRAPDERGCARRIVEHLARRAFRRPVMADEIDSLMQHYDSGSVASSAPAAPKPVNDARAEAGIEQTIAAILVSPDFLFRTIRTPSGATGPREFPLSDLELASRLSFFLWSQGPDETLLSAAERGELRNPEALRAQALRMLEDRRAWSLVRNFAMKWLDLDDLGGVEPDPELFPTFTRALREDMAAEVESFVASVLLEDRNIGDLLTARHTFLNERLARHYGIDSVHGPQFRRVDLVDSRRWGLLGKGAVQMRTSYGDRTSPVLRGAWVLDKLMGTPPTPPPPDVETDLAAVDAGEPRTLRARLESHRSKPGCSQCHGVIDPIGFAMENFDAIGRWRESDMPADVPIDASTVLPSGHAVDGPVQLRQALFGTPDVLARALTEKLLMYAIGRELEFYDMPQVRAIVRHAATEDYRLSAIVSGIVTSDSFRMQEGR